MKEQKFHSMNIYNYLNFFVSDKYSVSGALGCITAFFSQLLMSMSSISAIIGVCTALVGLAVAVLSFYKLYIQVKKEKYEYEQLIKRKKYPRIEIESEKDLKI